MWVRFLSGLSFAHYQGSEISLSIDGVVIFLARRQASIQHGSAADSTVNAPTTWPQSPIYVASVHLNILTQGWCKTQATNQVNLPEKSSSIIKNGIQAALEVI